MYSWDYHSSASIWSGLRVQPILTDEVQTFKAIIAVHKLLQEGHPIVRSPPPSPTDMQCIKEAQNQTSWLETCSRTVGGDVSRGT